MVSASQQLIHVQGIGAGGGVLAQHGEIGGHLSIEQSHLLEFGARQAAQTARVRLGKKGSQPVPVGPAFRDPLVGEDLSHGPGYRPEFRSA